MASRLNLSHFFKGSFEEDPDVAVQALMRSILIRTQFLPTVRHVIGWRGLKQSSAAVEGWTAKIRDYAGVFAQFFMGVESTPGWATGLFGLCYFLDPKEPLVERCSLRAAAFTQTEDYRHCIRDFLRHPEMCELFAVGSMLLSLRGRVQDINPGAPQFCTTHGDLNPALIFDGDSAVETNQVPKFCWKPYQ
jgi:hypothetical protein